MNEEQDLFSTWGIFFDIDDPLCRYCDMAMHWTCYATWEHSSRFARGYFDMWVDEASRNFYWGVVYVDDEVLVTVNPVPPIASFCVVVEESGERYMPKLEEWAQFVRRGPDIFGHEMERAALERILPRLRKLGSDPERIAARACFPEPDDAWTPCATLDIEALVAAQKCPASSTPCPNCGRSGSDDAETGNVVPLFVCATCGRPALDT